MGLRCENCGTHILMDVDIVDQRNVCPHCEHIIVFDPDKAQVSHDVIQPSAVRVEETASQIYMSIQWREAGAARESAYIGLFFTGVSLVTGVILPPLGIILGLFTAYVWAAYFLNHTAINIDHAYLTVVTSPLPFIANPMQRLPLHDIDRLYHRSMRDGATLQIICLLMHDGMKYDILMAVSEEEARFIIHVITSRVHPYTPEIRNEVDSRWFDDALGSAVMR